MRKLLLTLSLSLICGIHAYGQAIGSAGYIWNVPILNTTPTDGQVLAFNVATGRWEPTNVAGVGSVSLGGDLSGNSSNASVIRLQGRAMSSTAPTTGQLLQWNGTNWIPWTLVLQGPGASTLGGVKTIVCDGVSHIHEIQSDGTPVCTGDTGSGGGGAVSSVFGRSGNVVATTGDYNFNQVTGQVSAIQLPANVVTGTSLTTGQVLVGAGGSTVGSSGKTLPTGAVVGDTDQQTLSNKIINLAASTTGAAKFNMPPGSQPATPANGDVYNDGTNLNMRIAGAWRQFVTSNFNFSGDVTGPPGATSVVALRGVAISSSVPTTNQVLAYNGVNWAPAAGGGGGGGGASASFQLTDFLVARTSSTVLTIAQGCTVGTPCNVRFGNRTYTFTSNATVTISAGTGTAYLYISFAGILTVGHNVTAVCSGCTAASGITAFPVDALPLAYWTSTSGTWDVSGYHDQRSFIAMGKKVTAGTGILITDNGDSVQVASDGTGGGGGGASISKGTVSSIPSCSSANANSVYFPTDSPYHFFCNGTSWDYRLDSTFVTPADNSLFAWGRVTATATTIGGLNATTGETTITAAADAQLVKPVARYIANTHSLTFDIRAAVTLTPIYTGAASGPSGSAGIVVMNTIGSGGFQNDQCGLYVRALNAASPAGGTANGSNIVEFACRLNDYSESNRVASYTYTGTDETVWLRLQATGTNFIGYISKDKGNTWIQVMSTTIAAAINSRIDNLGWFVSSDNSASAVNGSLLHWSVQ